MKRWIVLLAFLAGSFSLPAQTKPTMYQVVSINQKHQVQLVNESDKTTITVSDPRKWLVSAQEYQKSTTTVVPNGLVLVVDGKDIMFPIISSK